MNTGFIYVFNPGCQMSCHNPHQITHLLWNFHLWVFLKSESLYFSFQCLLQNSSNSHFWRVHAMSITHFFSYTEFCIMIIICICPLIYGNNSTLFCSHLQEEQNISTKKISYSPNSENKTYNKNNQLMRQLAVANNKMDVLHGMIWYNSMDVFVWHDI